MFTSQDVGTDTSALSLHDALPISGTYTLASGEFNQTVDAGLLPIDLELSKSVDNTTPEVGTNEASAVTVTNNNASPGVSTATDVTVKDVLPAGLSYVSDDSGGNYN